MTYSTYIKVFVLAVSFAVASWPAQAQWTFNPSLVSNIMSPINLNPCTGGACGSPQDSATSENTTAPTSELSFQPSNTQRAANLAKFVENRRKVDPAGATDMQNLCASTDVIEQIGQGIAPYGLRTDNVADANAVYWITAWQAAHGETSDFSKSQTQAVTLQAAKALLSTPEFAGAPDAVKQEMAEAYLVQAAFIQASVDVVKSDPTVANGLPATVREGAIKSGLDLDAMVLTENGFVALR